MSKARRKGTEWETTIVYLLKEHGLIHAERRALTGPVDKGDISVHPDVVIQCRNTKSIDLAKACKDAKQQAHNASATVWVAFIKRRNHSAAQGYAVTEVGDFAEILRRLYGHG